MARRRRPNVTDSFFHVTNRSLRRATIFARPADYRAFLAVLGEGMDCCPVRLLSYCILANHWHLVLGPTDSLSVSRLLQWVTATHAIRWNRVHNCVGTGGLYQGRFHGRVLESGGELVRVCRYVERNALSANLVRRAQDWPWCSLTERLRETSRVPLITSPFLTSETWVDYVNSVVTAREEVARKMRRGADRDLEPAPPTPSVENTSDPVMHVEELLRDVAADPGGLARGTKESQRVGRAVRRAHQNQTDAHVERAKHLRVRHPARLLQPPKKRRHGPAFSIE